MKRFFTLLLVVIVSISAAKVHSKDLKSFTGPEKIYYGVKVNDVLCGYAITDASSIDERKIEVLQEIFVMSTALGMKINTHIDMKQIVDRETERVSFYEMKVEQGETKLTIKTEVRNDTAYYSSTMQPNDKAVYLPDDVITDNNYYSSFVKNDFIDGNITEKTYKIFDFQQGEILDCEFTKVGEETIELGDKKYETIVIEQLYTKTQLTIKGWYDKTGDAVRILVMNSRDIFLADKSVIKKIQVADLDKNLFAKANKSIGDISNLVYMKVKAKVEPIGMKLTVDDLNVGYQKFTGSAENNKVDGIFEITLNKYDGKNAPLFPHRYDSEELQKYLSPSERIESDDPELAAKAMEITEGAKDSWDAMKRLCKWVSENIDYVIPGGISAKDTYERRIGECGAHSILLAGFCRSVGIPARVVWGCMYVPNYGGSFGQHGWTEVYMGKEAGWIPVDATANQIDYADAGHIRIGELEGTTAALNPREFEILDYKIKQDENAKDLEKIHADKLGSYTNLENGNELHVIILDGALTVDIPNRVKLALHPADDKDRYFAKMSPALFVKFQTNDGDRLAGLEIHQLLKISKKLAPEKIPADIPDKYKTHLGTYILPQTGSKFEVKYESGELMIHDFKENVDVKFYAPDEEGWMLDKFEKNYVKFNMNENGEVESYTLDAVARLLKGKLASNLIEKIIDEEGTEAGIKKLFQIRDENDPDYIISERTINLLGYKYMNNGKMDEAMAVFKANIELRPDSFNVYDSIGECYMKSGNKEEAIKNYNKSLELNPKNENAQKMLKKIDEEM